MLIHSTLLLFPIIITTITPTTTSPRTIFAVNCGGEAHTDVHSINYQKDTLKTGIASDYGKHLLNIGRVDPRDNILYQTERYHHSTFGYEIPVDVDGEYVMVIKFCEVYFNAANMKVFDVVLNGDHTVISDLDIHEKVGHGVAYDEVVPFRVAGKGQLLLYNGQESDIRGGKIRIEFIKGYRDNPKVNAIYVVEGTEGDIPHLPSADNIPPPSNQDSDSEDYDEETQQQAQPQQQQQPENKARRSGPKTPDPYEDISLSSAIFPVFVAIGAFIPLLFCLCRL